jgi:hypothetical protein
MILEKDQDFFLTQEGEYDGVWKGFNYDILYIIILILNIMRQCGE